MDRILRSLLLIPILAVFLIGLSNQLERSLIDTFYYFYSDNPGLQTGFWLIRTATAAVMVSWIPILIGLEIRAHFRTSLRPSRLLIHFRYAPIFVAIFSAAVIFAFDAGMIEYSKSEIRKYVFDPRAEVVEPNIELHSDYRGWCGNGYFVNISELYLNVAEEGLDSERPEVRARALLATRETADLFNGTDREHFVEVLGDGCKDPSSLVRDTANGILLKNRADCAEFDTGPRSPALIGF